MQFAQNVFPESAHLDDEGHLSIDGVSVASIAEEFSTPVMVYSARDIKEDTQRFVDEFDCVLYSMKAAPIIGLGRIIQALGAGCTVAGEGELEVALRSGFDPRKIVMHGNNKSVADIASGLNNGIGRFVIEDSHECDRIESVAKDLGIEKVDVELRVTPGVEAHTHEYIMTGAIDSKFGCPIEFGMAREVCDRIVTSKILKLRGFHCHIGSGIFDHEPMALAAKILAEFFVNVRNDYAQQGITIDINEINVGGGFGVPYEPDDGDLSTIEMARAVKQAVDDVCAANDLGHIEVWCEPGKAIVGRAGVTIYRVGSIKEIPDTRKYIAVDGGMSDNIRPVLYRAVHCAWIDGKGISSDTHTTRIVGKHCEEGDILGRDLELPSDVALDDLVVMSTTGAYCFPMSSNYNMLPHIPVVLVDSENEPRVTEIVRRQTIDEMLDRMV